jgi:hypothetical protein
MALEFFLLLSEVLYLRKDAEVWHVKNRLSGIWELYWENNQSDLSYCVYLGPSSPQK